MRKEGAVELQGLSAARSRYPRRSPDFSSMLSLSIPRVTVNSPPPSLWWGRFDLFARIGGWKRRCYDHVEFVLAELAPDCHHCSSDRAEEGRTAPLKEDMRREEEAGRVRYNTTRRPNGWGRLSMGFGNAIEGGGVRRGWLSWCGGVVLSQAD